jgi:hypothetical protein
MSTPTPSSTDSNNAATALSRDFYGRLERADMHYGKLFNISQKYFDADAEQVEHYVRGWVIENSE